MGAAWPVPSVVAVLRADRVYAVRSSSLVEDGRERSFAGQFVTRLGVPGEPGAIGRAVTEVLGSADTPTVTAYRGGSRGDTAGMAVIVQEQVAALRAGVAFSRNPVTGLDEVVVESVAGFADRLMAGTATPERWVFRWGAFTTRPPEGDEALHESVARGARAVAAAYGDPVDVEWAWDGSNLWWLQVRPITGLDAVTVYSRRIAKEVLPGVISPLTWSVNVPVVNRAWVAILDRLVGPTGLDPSTLARRFGGRAYFDMTALGRVFEVAGMPRDSLEQLLGLDEGPEQPAMRPGLGASFRLLPRLAVAGWGILRYPRRAQHDLDALLADAAADRPTGHVEDAALSAAIGRALERSERAAHANIVVPILAAAAAGRARRAMASAGVDPDRVDPTAGVPGAGDHDPDRGLDSLRGALAALDPGILAGLASRTWDDVEGDPTLTKVVEAVEDYLGRFGAQSDRTTDLTAVPWREDPMRVVAMASSARGERRAVAVREAAPTATRRLVRQVERAGRLQVLREAVSQAYTAIYMDLRPLLLEAGRRLAERGFLDDAGDVVLLELDEVLVGLAGTAPDREAIVSRASELAEAEGYRVPDLIVGDDFVPVPVADGTTEFRGVGSSKGRVRGPVQVVRDPTAVGELPVGVVVVVPHSDVSWTPLFARASAVVSESGGMLSHSSIVAREFGIPCVVSAEGACDLGDGTQVVVDGYEGVVTVVG
jgi:phosphohistidine swiveling domain-containing protein